MWYDINRMYLEEPWMKPWWTHPMLNQPTNLFSEKRTKLILLDLVDTGEGYQIIAELPGVKKKDIDVKVTPHTISICGETETNIRKKNRRICQERTRVLVDYVTSPIGLCLWEIK